MTFLDRLLGRQPIARKAVYGGNVLATYQNDVPLSVLDSDPRERMKRYLRAYKVGWFYKAGRKISSDIAGLTRTLAYEDTEGDNADEITPAALTVPFEQLDPLEQFLRLMEKPNPWQTGRTLFTKTQIRVDFAGTAFWYLEGGEGKSLPTGIYGISPTRMWPSVNARNELIGWVMDKDERGGGVPFTVDEILPFIVPGADEDMWVGQGVVEAVYAQVPLSEQMARHTNNVLATGGRLAGFIWPKERALSEDEYQDAQRAWRNVASDPNAARRMLIFPEPMEYAAGASTPAEIGIPELAQLSREEILSAFPVGPEMLGLPMPAGLNASGESRRELKGEYWEGSIHPRVELLEETIQWGLITRYEQAVRRPLDFDIEEPNLDDASSLIEKVGALKALVSVGFDPKEAVSAVGLDHIMWDGLPGYDTEPAGMAASMTERGGSTVQETVVGGNEVAVAEPAAKAVDRRMVQLPGFQTAMRTFLNDQQERVADDIERVLGPMTKDARKATKDEAWWDAEREDALLQQALRGLYVRLSREALGTVADALDRVVLKGNVTHITAEMLKAAGERIHGINETTHQAVADQVAEGIRRGYSTAQIANGVGHEAYAGIRNAAAFDEARAELVARTETMLAYNKAALLGYQEFDVSQVQAIDGDFDPVCAERDGQVFSIEEAMAIEDHPNGTLDWIPLSKSVDVEILERSTDSPETIAIVALGEALTALAKDIGELKTSPPVINVPAPVVISNGNGKARDITDVRIVDSVLPPKTRSVKRDRAGRITEITES